MSEQTLDRRCVTREAGAAGSSSAVHVDPVPVDEQRSPARPPSILGGSVPYERNFHDEPLPSPQGWWPGPRRGAGPPGLSLQRGRCAQDRRNHEQRRWRRELRLHLRDDHARDAQETRSGTGSRRARTQASKDTGSTLKYSADPDATKQAVLIQNAIDSNVDGIATTLVTPDALIPSIKKAVAAGIPVDTFNSGTDFFAEGRRAHPLLLRRVPGRAGGREEGQGRRSHEDPLHDPAGRLGRAGGPVRGRQEHLPEHPEPAGQRCGRLRSHLRHPGQAQPGQGHQLGHHPRRRPGAGHHQGHPRGGQQGQGRHVRPEHRRGPGSEGRQAPVLPSTSSPTSRATWRSPSSTSTRRTATSWAAARPS